MVKRYDVDFHDGKDIFESVDGDFVRFEDYEYLRTLLESISSWAEPYTDSMDAEIAKANLLIGEE